MPTLPAYRRKVRPRHRPQNRQVYVRRPGTRRKPALKHRPKHVQPKFKLRQLLLLKPKPRLLPPQRLRTPKVYPKPRRPLPRTQRQHRNRQPPQLLQRPVMLPLQQLLPQLLPPTPQPRVDVQPSDLWKGRRLPPRQLADRQKFGKKPQQVMLRPPLPLHHDKRKPQPFCV